MADAVAYKTAQETCLAGMYIMFKSTGGYKKLHLHQYHFM